MTMDEKWMGFWRHMMGTVGMALVGLGIVDEATWLAITGAAMTIIPFFWSWYAKL